MTGPTLAIDLNTVVLAVIGFVLVSLLGLLGWLAKRVLERIEKDVGESARGVSSIAGTVSIHTTDIAVLRTEIAHLRTENANARLKYEDLIGYVQKLGSLVKDATGFEPRRSVESERP